MYNGVIIDHLTNFNNIVLNKECDFISKLNNDDIVNVLNNNISDLDNKGISMSKLVKTFKDFDSFFMTFSFLHEKTLYLILVQTKCRATVSSINQGMIDEMLISDCKLPYERIIPIIKFIKVTKSMPFQSALNMNTLVLNEKYNICPIIKEVSDPNINTKLIALHSADSIFYIGKSTKTFKVINKFTFSGGISNHYKCVV